MRLRIKPWRLEPVGYEECLTYLREGKVDRLIVPRTLPELDRLVEYICFQRGSYLVTGYRGVGKTSFVNYALALASQRLESLDPPAILVRVSLSLARNYEVEKLLRRTIRRLYEALVETEVGGLGIGNEYVSVYSLLPADMQADLTIAYQKTSKKIAEAAKEALKTVMAATVVQEFNIGGEIGNEANLQVNPLPTKLAAKIAAGFRRSKATSTTKEISRETMNYLEHLEYDDEIAESELMRLIRRLSKISISLPHREIYTIRRKCPWLWRILGHIRHRDYLHKIVDREETRRLHLVFVFDELDKVSHNDAERMLQSLKGLLTTSDATFIFIGGWEFASRWLSRTSPDGDLIYSLFTEVIYVPLYTDEELDLLATNLFVGFLPNDGRIKHLLEHIKVHSIGTPRGFLGQLLHFVRWEKGQPLLEIPDREGDLFYQLFPHVYQVNSQIPPTLPAEVRDALIRCTNQWLMIAEREAEFSYKFLFDRGVPEIEGGQWHQALSEHYERFFETMLEAGVFQPLERESKERFRFNQRFSLGTWVRRSSIPPFESREKSSLPSGPFEAPPKPVTFVNREAELRTVIQALDSDISVIQIVGMGGIGKTALALKVVYEIRDRFPDGVLWISVGAGTTSKSILRHIALSYGKELVDAELETLSAQVRTLLANKQTLIVLDSAESLPEDELEYLIPGTPKCSLLMTTRKRFIQLEQLGETVTLRELPREHSLSLLRKSAGYRRVTTALEIASKICALLGDHPLAIEIAGRLARHRGWDMLSLLGNLQKAEIPDVNLSHILALSYEALTSEQKKVLTAAAVFEGSFSADGVAFLLKQEKSWIVESHLDTLYILSLVKRDVDGMYQTHPLVRTYVRSVTENEKLQEMYHRHARYMLQWTRKIKGAAK